MDARFSSSTGTESWCQPKGCLSDADGSWTTAEIEGDDDYELETTELKDIKDFLKEKKKEVTRETGFMDKESFQNSVLVKLFNKS